MSILYKKFTDTSFEVCYQVHSPHDGMRLDQFLQIYFPSFSRQQIKEKIRLGEVIIEKRVGKHKPNTKVYEKDKLVCFVNKTSHEDEWWNGEKLELDKLTIAYEDDEIFAINKPPYMATHPTGKHLFNCATVHLEAKEQKTIHSVHRLDRETSGMLLLARNPTAAKKYTQYFENNQVSKCYFFIAASNELYNGEQEFVANERLDTGGEGLMRVLIGHYPSESKTGKVAKTHFHVLHTEGKYVLGLAFPVTGRQHQIRVHALAHGLPLLGDKIYYGSYKMFQSFKDLYATKEDYDKMELSRHALHATAINVPFEESRRTFFSPFPKDLILWMKQKITVSPEDIEAMALKKINDYFKEVVK